MLNASGRYCPRQAALRAATLARLPRCACPLDKGTGLPHNMITCSYMQVIDLKMSQVMMKVNNLRSCPASEPSDVLGARGELIALAVAQRLASVFKSLSDPTRLRIISLVAEQEHCVSDLAAALDVKQSTISHQLRDMRILGLVSFRRDGRRVFYRLDDPHVRSLFEQGLAHGQE